MTEPTLLARVQSTLDGAGIRSALIGASALATYGVTRSTLDHDLLVSDARVLVPATWASLGPDATVDVRRGTHDDPLSGVVRITARSDRDVDVILGRYSWQTELVANAAPIMTSSGAVRVVSAVGLVLLKLYAGAPQDLWDIQQLRAACGESLDREVLERIGVLPNDAQAAWIDLSRQG